MLTYRILNGRLIIEGRKLTVNDKPVISARVQFVNEDFGLAYASTTTDETGYWTFNLDAINVPSGRHVIRFVGSGTKQDIQPLGDWERIDVIKDDIL